MPTAAFPQLAWFAAPLMQVLDERKARGIADTVGRDASPRLRQPRQAHPRAELLEKLSGAPADAPKTGYAAFAPPSLIGT
ncbi:carboxymuconolactone decarboxylase [Prevotella sp. CAG:755]|nr:carboxymuconolactone decarboxylase [Prevotella sp. CAG:755]